MEEQEGYMEAELKLGTSVPAGQGRQLTQSFREPGKITQIMFHFPPGCNGLVEMRLYKDGNTFYPINGYLALNNATPVYYVQADYYRNEPMMLEILNHDAVNAHAPTCTVVVRYKKRDWEEFG